MHPLQKVFTEECAEELAVMAQASSLKSLSSEWLAEAQSHKYSYHFSWLGRPVIQYPQDLMALQEIIFCVQPDLIIETGIAHGGSLIFSASLLELNAACGGPQNAHVLGVDIEIRQHNREAIEAHPMYKRITLLQGSSIAPDVLQQVFAVAQDYQRILVVLDSNHTHAHVNAELNAYAPLVALGSYCIVFDTFIEFMPEGSFPDRPWDKGNNPMTAVQNFLKNNLEFEIDTIIDAKLMISAAPHGYLKRKTI